MADRPAAIHWEVARRIIDLMALGDTAVEAIRKADQEYASVVFTQDDRQKIAGVLDQISAQYQPEGYWLGLLIQHLGSHTDLIPQAKKMPRWGWVVLVFLGGLAVYKWTRPR